MSANYESSLHEVQTPQNYYSKNCNEGPLHYQMRPCFGFVGKQPEVALRFNQTNVMKLAK